MTAGGAVTPAGRRRPGGADPTGDAEALGEAVLTLVEQVPGGRATTYGALGDAVGRGPRWVGRVLAGHGGAVPWWRVVRADGSLPPRLAEEAACHWAAEGTPRRGHGVDLRVASWSPAGGAAG